MQRRVILSLAVLATLGLSSLAHADGVLIVGTHQLLANTPNQEVDIYVSGISSADNIAGTNLAVIVADGGPGNNLTGPGTITGPSITADIIGTGTLFNQNNDGQGDYTSGLGGPQVILATTATTAGTVNPQLAGVQTNGAGGVLLARLFFSTVGVAPGSYDLNLGGSNNPTSGDDPDTTSLSTVATGPIGLSITDGQLVVAPEPSSIVMGLMAAAGLGAVIIRKRRAG